MSAETPGRSLPTGARRYVITITETYVVIATTEAEAAAIARELRNGPGADTIDVQVDAA